MPISDRKTRHPLLPAGADWQRARDYCQWVGKLTGLPFDLPTEAQWEYAARSRGQRFVFPTDNGNIDHGRNVPASYAHMDMISPFPKDADIDKDYRPYTVGMFPPNPLGLYDMLGIGFEWTLDWHDPQHSPVDNPTGPEKGTKKVVRGQPRKAGIRFYGVTALRGGAELNPMDEFFGEKRPMPVNGDGLRCVVNSTKPLQN